MKPSEEVNQLVATINIAREMKAKGHIDTYNSMKKLAETQLGQIMQNGPFPEGWEEDENKVTVKMKLEDIYLDINIRRLAERYFKQKGTWLYSKLDRDIVNGKRDDFSPEELEQLKAALLDFSDRVRRAAETL